MAKLSDDLNERLEKNRRSNRYRQLRPQSVHTRKSTSDSTESLVDLSHNDYLGLSQKQSVIEAGRSALEQWGSGSAASRLVTGNLEIHEILESEIARFKGSSTALLFPTGYQASLAVMASLPQKGDTIYLDRYVHACLVEGAKLSEARLRVFPHQDIGRLEQLIEKDLTSNPDRGKIWIAVDGVYSMDGDAVRLDELLNLARKFDAVCIVDDAHGTGVIGKSGRGITEHTELNAIDFEENLIMIATLSKAIGSQGGVVLGSDAVRNYLINHGKSFIYTTGLNPGSTGSALESIRILNSGENPVSELQKRTSNVQSLFRDAGLNILDTESAIIPLITGEEKAALDFSEKLLDQGILASAIRPPTVPKNTSRLRLVVNLRVSESLLMESIEKIIELAKNDFRLA